MKKTPVAFWRSLTEVPADLGRPVVVIGTFDGVHRGHQAVLRRARALADAEGTRLVAVTFDPHPMGALRPERAPSVLTDVRGRAELLGSAGVDAVMALSFDLDMAAWTPTQFVDTVLVEGMNATAVVVGANFRFGRRAAGDVEWLREVGRTRDLQVVEVELEGGPQIWSSTYVRTCLAAGDIASATEALGRPFTLRGCVVAGDRRGRLLGFPTANLDLPAGTADVPDGVYAGWLSRIDTSETWPAAISVGTNPTFEGERARRVESHVLDHDDLALYGVEIEVAFAERLRGMVAFDSVDALLRQMRDDVNRTRQLVGPSPAELHADQDLQRIGA